MHSTFVSASNLHHGASLHSFAYHSPTDDPSSINRYHCSADYNSDTYDHCPCADYTPAHHVASADESHAVHLERLCTSHDSG